MLRSIFSKVGVDDADGYSEHSLRCGFASRTAVDGWDTKSMMEYVGWKSIQSAMRYIDSGDRFGRRRPQNIGDKAEVIHREQFPGDCEEE